MRFKQGMVTNNKTGRSKDIIVDASPTSWKESMIGCFIIGLGISYLTNKAFRNGAKAYEEAEFKTLMDIDVVDLKD